MSIELWSRKEGLVRPPTDLAHAEPGSRDFHGTFRVRVYRWSLEALRRLQWGTSMGEVINPVERSMESLDHDLRSAYGRMHLVYPEKDSPTGLRTSKGQLRAHTATCYDTELMDYIDAVFQKSAEIIERSTEGEGGQEAQRLASEINRIFEEEGVGYRWVGGRLVRFDGEITHTEATLPALNALAAGRFGAAEGEFDAAVAAYGRGAWRDTLTHANAALESVLKIATGKKGTAGPLIAEAKKKGLIPDYLEASAESLAEMAHAVPAARGQQGSSHGLGDKPPKADERLARLVLTTTAAWITFLADRSP